MADELIESQVRQWLREHPGGAHCARCVATGLILDDVAVQAAMDEPPSLSSKLSPGCRYRRSRRALYHLGRCRFRLPEPPPCCPHREGTCSSRPNMRPFIVSLTRGLGRGLP